MYFPLFIRLRQNIAATNRAKNEESSSSYHRKSQSLDAATIAAQVTGNADGSVLTKRKSYAQNEK